MQPRMPIPKSGIWKDTGFWTLGSLNMQNGRGRRSAFEQHPELSISWQTTAGFPQSWAW